jgi:hypothetical protein
MILPDQPNLVLKADGTAFAPTLSCVSNALQSVLNECSISEMDVGFSNRGAIHFR